MRLKQFKKKQSLVPTYPHPPACCGPARRRVPRVGKAGRGPGDARSRGCDRTGIPAGARTRMLQRRRARRAAWGPRRGGREPGSGCGSGRAMPAGARDNRDRRTPETPIWTYQRGLKCPTKNS